MLYVLSYDAPVKPPLTFSVGVLSPLVASERHCPAFDGSGLYPVGHVGLGHCCPQATCIPQPQGTGGSGVAGLQSSSRPSQISGAGGLPSGRTGWTFGLLSLQSHTVLPGVTAM